MSDVFAASGLTCVRGERIVFQRLSFQVGAGGALLLRGPNGAGKSSLLRLAAGFLPPAEGTLSWNGQPIGADIDAHRARLAYVGHLDAVKPALSVAENLAFWLALGGDRRGDAVADALAPLGLGHLVSLPAAYLSAGQRRRLNLSRLLATKAALWLLDEPMSSLDDASATALAKVIEDHRARGGMAVIATHQDLPLADAATLAIGSP